MGQASVKSDHINNITIILQLGAYSCNSSQHLVGPEMAIDAFVLQSAAFLVIARICPTKAGCRPLPTGLYGKKLPYGGGGGGGLGSPVR